MTTETSSASDEATTHRTLKRFWLAIRDEPLIHFAILAALLFVAQALWARDDREVVIVDIPTQDFLIKQKEDLLLRPLSAEEKDEAIASYVEDEMLVREARRRGFNNSSRVRALLIQNMRYFYSRDLAAPSESELRAYYEANADRFLVPETLTLDHVFFDDEKLIPNDLRDRLNKSADHTKLGSSKVGIPYGSRIRGATRSALAKTFGANEAHRILSISDDKWHGPFESPQGFHFLRIAERKPAVHPSFESAKKWIETDWRIVQQRKALEDELKKIGEQYKVEIADRGGR